MDKTAKHIIFIGQVQGVGFRFTVFNIANRHQLAGHVRNLSNGDVSIIAQGPEEDIYNCLREIQESLGSYVRETKIEETPYNPQYEDFKITF